MIVACSSDCKVRSINIVDWIICFSAIQEDRFYAHKMNEKRGEKRQVRRQERKSKPVYKAAKDNEDIRGKRNRWLLKYTMSR